MGREGLFGSGGVCVWCLTGSVDVCSDVRPAVERVCPVHAPLAAGGGGVLPGPWRRVPGSSETDAI